MRINRKELLQKLLCIEPGIAKQGGIQQSSCVVMRNGRFYSLSQEIACSIKTGLPKELEGAIQADKLLKLFDKIPDEELDIDVRDKTLYLKGRNKKASLTMEEEILSPIDEVELPTAKQWITLYPEFCEAVDLVHRCTKEPSDSFIEMCVHVHPQHLEATDNTRMIRYPIDTFVERSVLVRGSLIGAVAQLGMTKGAETENWLHFHNPMGLRLSVRKFALESYPPIEQFLNQRGRSVTFPMGLAEIADRASILADDKDSVCITLSEGVLSMKAESPDGIYKEQCKLKYNGEDVSFWINYKLVKDLLKRNGECEVAKDSIRVDGGGKYIYVSSLEVR